MKVILLQDVKGVGKKGDTKEVPDGYATNYLFPQKKAQQAAFGIVKTMENQKQAQQRRKEQQLVEAQQLAAKLEQLVITITAKAGEKGRLFGAITNKQLAEELEKINISIDKRDIVLDPPIRTIGQTRVRIKVFPTVTANLTVHVVAQGPNP